MLKIKHNINNLNDNIIIPISYQNSFNTELNKEDDINKVFTEIQFKNKINSIVDMEKYRFEPATKILDDTQTSLIDSITFNLLFLNKKNKNWFTKQESTYSLIGFNNDDIRYQRNRLKKSFLRLSFYDSEDQTNQNLLFYTILYVDTIELYKNYVKEIINGNLNPINGFKVSFNAKDPIKTNTQTLTEGFYLYLYKDLLENSSLTMYMKAEFINSLNGERIILMNPKTIKTPDYVNGQSYTMTEFYKNLYTKVNLYYSSYFNKFLYYYGDERNVSTLGDKNIIIDLYQANVR